MKRVLQIIIYLSIGFFIGLYFNNVSITQTEFYDEYKTEFYDNIITEDKTIEIYDTTELTEEILTNRNGKIIIEKVIGKVENYQLDGKILNANNNQNYISYKLVDGAKQGDKVLTYFIYNPFTNVCDDIIIRLDFIIDDNII